MTRPVQTVVCVILFSVVFRPGMLAASPSSKKHAVSARGIHVGPPKIYDDRSLELMLQAAEARLATLQFLDQASLAAKIGALQGAAAQQSAFSVQATGLPLPQVATKLSTTTAPSGTTASSETDTTKSSVNPAIPSLPTGGPPAWPTSFSPSALDTLNEEMQLTYEVANLRLLLQGSLNDRFSSRSTGQQAKRTATIGFSISVEAPKESRFDNAVAEVEVTVKTGPVRTAPEAPSLMSILPRERSYNEATITDKSKGFGLGVVTHVFSVGVAGSKRGQTFYFVQDLDTVAFERKVSTCDSVQAECSTVFGWQFRPTLGRKKLRSGLRQTFAQLSFPVGDPVVAQSLGTVTVTARWRRYDPKTGAVGNEIHDEFERSPGDGQPDTPLISNFTLSNFDLTPDAPEITWSDAGNGQVFVEAAGNYLRGTSVSIGAVTWKEGTPGFSQDRTAIRFAAPAAQLVAAEDAYLVAPNGDKQDLENILGPRAGYSGQALKKLQERPELSPQERQALQELQKMQARLEPTALVIVRALAKPWSNTESRIEVTYVNAVPGKNPNVRPLVLLGDQVFGLFDHPYTMLPDAESCLQSGGCTLSFHAPTALVRSAGALRLKQLFFGPHAAQESGITFVNDFTVTKMEAVKATKECTLFAIQGSGLNNAEIKVRIGDYEVAEKKNSEAPCQFSGLAGTASSQTGRKDPLTNGVKLAVKASAHESPTQPTQQDAPCPADSAYTERILGPTTLLLGAPKCLLNGVTAIEVYRGSGEDAQSVVVPLQAPKPDKVELDAAEAPVGVKSVKLTGKHLELVDLSGIVYSGSTLPASLAADGSYIEITLPEAMAKNPGFYALTVTLKDKTKVGALVHITSPEK